MRPETPKLLEDIRDAARFVLDITAAETVDSYTDNRLLRQGVERNFEIMGEAMGRLGRLDPETVARITDFRQVISFRNILIHGDDEIDHGRVWQVIQSSLSTLESEVVRLLGEGSGDAR